MYSYDERLQAVDPYLKRGKRGRATIRQLGYPTKNSLRQWCQEFQERGDLQNDYVRSKQKYSGEQKSVAIEHYMKTQVILFTHHSRVVDQTRAINGRVHDL